MSEQNPTPRRKIAGERRPRAQRPEQPEAPSTPNELPPPAASTRVPDSSGGGRPPRSGATASLGQVPNWLLIGLAVLLFAAVVFDVIVGVRGHTAEAQQTTSSAAITSALRQAPTQAETAAVRALAFDYKTLKSDAAEAKTYMTPQYAEKFQKTVDSLLTAPANQRKAHVEADVKASGVVSATASKVDVMLFVDQTSQTTLQSQPQTYLNRVVFTMVKSGDTWLVDDVTAL